MGVTWFTFCQFLHSHVIYSKTINPPAARGQCVQISMISIEQATKRGHKQRNQDRNTITIKLPRITLFQEVFQGQPLAK